MEGNRKEWDREQEIYVKSKTLSSCCCHGVVYGAREGMEVRRAVAAFPCQHFCGTSRCSAGLVQVPGLVEGCWDVRETK